MGVRGDIVKRGKLDTVGVVPGESITGVVPPPGDRICGERLPGLKNPLELCRGGGNMMGGGGGARAALGSSSGHGSSESVSSSTSVRLVAVDANDDILGLV